MYRFPRTMPFFFAVALALCGCGNRAENIHAVKASDYDKVPYRLLLVMQDDPLLNEEFEKSLARSLATCGSLLRYAYIYDAASVKAAHFDAVLFSHSLGNDRTTLTRLATGHSWSHVSKSRVEFSLLDLQSQRNVWKEQIDFTNHDSRPVDGKEDDWADALFQSMVKAGLTGVCDAAHAVPPPADLVFPASR